MADSGMKKAQELFIPRGRLLVHREEADDCYAYGVRLEEREFKELASFQGNMYIVWQGRNKSINCEK